MYWAATVEPVFKTYKRLNSLAECFSNCTVQLLIYVLFNHLCVLAELYVSVTHESFMKSGFGSSASTALSFWFWETCFIINFYNFIILWWDWEWETISCSHKNLKQEWLLQVLAFWNKIKTHKRFKRMLFIQTKHNMQIFRVIPFIKLQNDTETTVKWWKTMKNEMESYTYLFLVELCWPFSCPVLGRIVMTIVMPTFFWSDLTHWWQGLSLAG